jgi:hypothetical protein
MDIQLTEHSPIHSGLMMHVLDDQGSGQFSCVAKNPGDGDLAPSYLSVNRLALAS